MRDTLANVPAQVVVLFPRSNSSTIYPLTITLANLALSQYSGEVGRTGSHLIHDSAIANFSGGNWVCILANSLSPPTANPTKWVFQVGSASAWVSTTNYVRGHVVTRSGTTYICILANINQVPPNATYWVALSSGIVDRGVWGTGSYVVGDSVDGLSNVEELYTLAKRIATDFYLWKLAAMEVRYQSVAPWESDGLHDVEFMHAAQGIATAVHRSAWEPDFGALETAGAAGSNDEDDVGDEEEIETYLGVTKGLVSGRINARVGKGTVELLTTLDDGHGNTNLVGTGETLKIYNACDPIPNDYLVEVFREPFGKRYFIHPLCPHVVTGSGGNTFDWWCVAEYVCVDSACTDCETTTGVVCINAPEFTELGDERCVDNGDGTYTRQVAVNGPWETQTVCAAMCAGEGDQHCGPCGPCLDFPCTICVDTSGVTNGSCTDVADLPSPLRLYRQTAAATLCTWTADSGGVLGSAGPLCAYNWFANFYYDITSARFYFSFAYDALSTVNYRSASTFSPSDAQTLCAAFFTATGVSFSKVGEASATLTWPATIAIKACATMPPEIFYSDDDVCQINPVLVTIIGRNFTNVGDTTVTFDPPLTNHVVSITGTNVMVVSIDETPPLGPLAATVENTYGTSAEIQVGTVVVCDSSAYWCVQVREYSDENCLNERTDGLFDGILCTTVAEFTEVGDTTACIYVNDFAWIKATALAGPYPTQAACQAAGCNGGTTPSLNSNTDAICQDAATITITGTGFTSPANTNVFAFSNGAAGTCTSVTGSTSCVVTFTTNPTSLGYLVATMTNGSGATSPTVVAVVELCGGGQLWYDTFTGADGTLLSAHTPDVGGTYSNVVTADKWTILGNKLINNVLLGTGGNCVARLTNPGITATTATVKVIINSTAGSLYLYLNPRNGLEGNCGILKFAGGWTVVCPGASSESVSLTDGVEYTLSVHDTGTSLRVEINGIVVEAAASAATSTLWTLEAQTDGASAATLTLNDLEITTP